MCRILLVGVAMLMLGACTAPGSIFKHMSEDELALYNATVPIDDMVYCFEEVRTGSHIKKKYCSSLAEITAALTTSYDQLNTMHQGSNGLLGSRGVGYYPRD